MKNRKEVTYEEAAQILGCSGRQVRRLFKRYKIEPLRRGYRTVRIPAETIIRLKIQLLAA